MNALAIAAPRSRARPFIVLAFGVLLGLTVSSVGFTSYDEVHRMFTFSELRMFLAFLGGVTLTSLGFFALRSRRRAPPRPIHKGTVPGALLFGVGWALAGVCPGVVIAQLGEGRPFALLSAAGIVTGTLAYRVAQRRLFRRDRGSCQ